MTVDIEETMTEARSKFDVKKRLAGRGLAKEDVVVYTDRAAGLALGDARVDEETNQFGLVIATHKIRTGVLGDIAEAEEDLVGAEGAEKTKLNRTLKALRAEKAELIEQLKSTRWTVSLESVPPVAIKRAERAARSKLDIKGKIPEDRIADYRELVDVFTLADVITNIHDHADGEDSGKIDGESALDIKEMLDPSEYRRIILGLGKVQYRDAVSDAVTSDADF